MRRLAKQSRDDKYTSRRDYQSIREQRALRIQFDTRIGALLLRTSLEPGNLPHIGFGGYLKPSRSCSVRVTILSNADATRSREFSLSARWNRIGLVADYDGEDEARVAVEFERPISHINLWGFDCAVLNVPSSLAEVNPTREQLEAVQICPETLYLSHQGVLNLDIRENQSSRITIVEGSAFISLKKCSYCGRELPVDRAHPGALAFHKHNAKISNHQNECRACKKWRINVSLNPLRTVDQLHESSLITRERSVLLREPQILQDIKDRNGEGLKSIVWRRFNKRCFRCGTALTLKEVNLDHTRPLAYLWPIDEYATCLCATCNNFKKDRFPRDVYNNAQLDDLAKITGLPRAKLEKRELNRTQLKRIVGDIVFFGSTWSARTFNATARKVLEINPKVDLWAILLLANSRLHELLVAELGTRPSEEG